MRRPYICTIQEDQGVTLMYPFLQNKKKKKKIIHTWYATCYKSCGHIKEHPALSRLQTQMAFIRNLWSGAYVWQLCYDQILPNSFSCILVTCKLNGETAALNVQIMSKQVEYLICEFLLINKRQYSLPMLLH